MVNHHRRTQQTTRSRSRRRRGRPCLQKFGVTSQDSQETNRRQSVDDTNPATGPTDKIVDHAKDVVTTSSTGGTLYRTGQDVLSSPQAKNTDMDSGFAGPNQHPQLDRSMDLPDAVVPEASMTRATGSQTTENVSECDAVVPSVCIHLVQSLSVPPHQSVLAKVQREDGCCQDTSLLFQHDEALNVLSGLSPDDAVIQPLLHGKSCILISNFTGRTRFLEGHVIGQATEVDVVKNPILGTPDSISRAFTIMTSSSGSCPNDPQDRHVQQKQKVREVLVH